MAVVARAVSPTWRTSCSTSSTSAEAALEFRAHGRREAYRRAIQQALEQVRVVGTADTAGVAARSGRAIVLYAAERWEETRACTPGYAARTP